MSNQEHHEKKGLICQFKSTIKKGSICQIKSTMKKEGSIMSIQEHHEKRINNVNSRAP
jgi:hypothetical protein